MPPLKSGTCAVCKTEDVKLRLNPFSNEEECEDCRTTGSKAIIGITDAKKEFKVKDGDLEGLQMVKEPKPVRQSSAKYALFLCSGRGEGEMGIFWYHIVVADTCIQDAEMAVPWLVDLC